MWFNIGVRGVPQQGSACFILAVDDSMRSILNWYTEEGIIFKGGSGAGVNLSRIRSSAEALEGGGTASGRCRSCAARTRRPGTIKSGGKTRRAAKMVILDVDHPDVEEFIWCKAREETKARVLRDAGFDMDLDGKDIHSIQYQNANNSVRVSDEFMQAVLADGDWDLTARGDGRVIATVKARQIWHEIAQAAWECADPGLQFDSTINRWHTSSNTARINGSNPCSEYMHIDNSACNLASLNLMKFLREDGRFDVEAFKASIEVLFTAQEIIVGAADYPTEKISRELAQVPPARPRLRQPGRPAMASGLAYDSDAGRAWAAAITALMTGHAYATSARTAGRMGPHDGYAENAEPMLNVLRMHRDASYDIDDTLAPAEILEAAQAAWEEAVDLGARHGVRNAQASVLAPTGTIGLLMDCDTTGIEPDLGLVKFKKLVGGGNMSIVNQTVPRALRVLGYSEEQVGAIVAYIDEHKSIVGAPDLKPEHLPVFACSMGDNTIHYRGHVRMMGAVQPFISGRSPRPSTCPRTPPSKTSRTAPGRVAPRRQGGRHLPRQLQGRPAALHGEEGRRGPTRQTSVIAADALAAELYAKIHRLEAALELAKTEGSTCRAARCASACRAGASRRPSPSAWRTARATSRWASTRTAGPARSSSRSPSRARRWRASWTPSRSRSAWGSSTACRSRPTCASTRT